MPVHGTTPVTPSNALVVRGGRLPLPPRLLELGATAVNYLDDGEPHLAGGPRIRPLTTFVLHETGGNTEQGCENSLQQKHYGVHLLLDSDGSISNYADLATEVCAHAGQANGISIGMEVVNEYRPEAMVPPHGPVIPAQWWTWVPKGKRREYVCPTDAQMRVALAFVPWICDHLGIPVAFPTAGLCAKRPRITGWAKVPKGWSAKPGPGIVAHQDFSKHADGRYMLERLMEQEMIVQR
jgi:N-acetylmuramoyl-L-alanine amidase